METSSRAVVSSTAMSQITLTNALTSPLLRLPAELRNMIYTYVGLATIIRPYSLETPNTANTAPIKYALELPGFLSASQQIRKEATTLIYKHSLFDFDVFDLCSWPPISTYNHEISEFITSIRISRCLAIEITLEIRNGRDLGELKFSNYRLPNLKKVCVGPCETRRPWENAVRMALKVWCGKGDLEVSFGVEGL